MLPTLPGELFAGVLLEPSVVVRLRSRPGAVHARHLPSANRSGSPAEAFVCGPKELHARPLPCRLEGCCSLRWCRPVQAIEIFDVRAFLGGRWWCFGYASVTWPSPVGSKRVNLHVVQTSRHSSPGGSRCTLRSEEGTVLEARPHLWWQLLLGPPNLLEIISLSVCESSL